MLTYKKFDHHDVIGYLDLYFAGCTNNRKLTTRYIFLLIDGVILWMSLLQNLVTISIKEVEYILCYKTSL